MKLSHVAHALYCEPWAIRPDMYLTMHNILQMHMRGEMPETSALWGMDDDKPTGPLAYEIIDGVAVVPISGVLGKRMSNFEKSCGGCDYDDITAVVKMIDDDPAIKAAVFDYDSPGGNVTGLREAAQAVKQINKPSVAYTELVAASAAYYLMCGSDAVYTAYSSQVGCIGTIMSFLDLSKYYENAGAKVEVISSGIHKGAGIPGTSLTEEQRTLLENNVMSLADEFYSWVRLSRGAIKESDMQGQCFRGSEAVKIGLTDRVGSLSDAIAEAKAMTARR